MPGIKSQLGEKSVGGQPRKVFTVEDESDVSNYPPSQSYVPTDQEYAEPQVRRRTYGQPLESKEILTNERRNEYVSQKREVYDNQSRISMSNRNRIEILLGIGRLTKEVEYDGVMFTLQSLKSREMREIFDSIKERKANDLDINYEIRAQTLARSLHAIDGLLFEDFLGSRKLNDKLAFIDELQERTVIFLHQKYSEMIDENPKKFNIADDKDAKEVAEQVKKS